MSIYPPRIPLFPLLLVFLTLFTVLSCKQDAYDYFYSGAVLPTETTASGSLRVVALGDTGTGPGPGPDKSQQEKVADDLAARAAGTVDPPMPPALVDLVLLLGDNFYENGVASVTDPQWNTAFLDIYDDFTYLPRFYAVAGNHDYNGNVSAQVDYTALNPVWIMPALSYSFSWILSGGTRIDFLGIDTNILVAGGDVAEAHWQWISNRLQAVTKGNIIVFGHHPVYSAGSHGDTPVLVDRLKPLLESHKVDLYFAGHDHNLEIRSPVAGVTYVVSGSGGKLRTVTAETESLWVGGLDPLDPFDPLDPLGPSSPSSPSIFGAIILDLNSTGWTLTARDSAAGSDVAESVTTGKWY